jgi:hypothetical protein
MLAASREEEIIMRVCMLVATLAFCLTSGRAFAQNSDHAVDEEEQMDKALRKLGHTSGQAFQCQSKQEQTRLEKTALDIATNVLRLFGSDRAFYFAAAFGAGATEKMDDKSCSEAATQFREMTAKLKALGSR